MEPTIDEKGKIGEYGPGLRLVRRRRWYLWVVILIYIPVIWPTLVLSGSNKVTAAVFGVWFVVLSIVVGFFAAARCPRCGNYFHMNGMSLLWFRHCLHCQLHLTADRKSPCKKG